MYFPGSFILPESPVLQCPFEGNSPGTGTIVNAAAAIPAFFWMQDNRRFTFLGMGYVNVYLADFHAMVAPVTYFRIENHLTTRRSYVR